uniref:INO80 complex subunit B-like conserved region domain-containing protein n=1 Tax=Taeniopygia guttata TaxID=59729 RepID=A0A674GSH7_TAEGU
MGLGVWGCWGAGLRGAAGRVCGVRGSHGAGLAGWVLRSWAEGLAGFWEGWGDSGELGWMGWGCGVLRSWLRRDGEVLEGLGCSGSWAEWAREDLGQSGVLRELVWGAQGAGAGLGTHLGAPGGPPQIPPMPKSDSTTPQRALLHKQQSQPLLQLPMGAKAKEVTEEMREKREERARRRRLQAARKAEESKNQTIERLTRTHKAKVRALRERRARPAACPVVHYRSTADGVTVSFPPGCRCRCPPPPPPAAPPARPCAVPGCPNARRYSCARTGRPLCSLGCYRRNLQLLQSAG